MTDDNLLELARCELPMPDRGNLRILPLAWREGKFDAADGNCMISVEEARERILADLHPTPAEIVALAERLGPGDRRAGDRAPDPAAGRCLGDGRLRAARR